MTIQQLRRLYEARPFQPFVLHLADGQQVPVPHNDFMALSPTGRTVTVYDPEGTASIIDLLLVTRLEVRADGQRRARSR